MAVEDEKVLLDFCEQMHARWFTPEEAAKWRASDPPLLEQVAEAVVLLNNNPPSRAQAHQVRGLAAGREGGRSTTTDGGAYGKSSTSSATSGEKRMTRIIAVLVGALAALVFVVAAAANGQDKIVICHAAGLEGDDAVRHARARVPGGVRRGRTLLRERDATCRSRAGLLRRVCDDESAASPAASPATSPATVRGDRAGMSYAAPTPATTTPAAPVHGELQPVPAGTAPGWQGRGAG